MLVYDGKAKELLADKEYAATSFIVDFRFPQKDGKSCLFTVNCEKNLGITLSLSPTGEYKIKASDAGTAGTFKELKPSGKWNRLRVMVFGGRLEVTVNDGKPAGLYKFSLPEKKVLGLHPDGQMEFRNLFVRELGK